MYKLVCKTEFSNNEETIEHSIVHDQLKFKTYSQAFTYMNEHYNMDYMVETEDYWSSEWESSNIYEFERTTLSIVSER